MWVLLCQGLTGGCGLRAAASVEALLCPAAMLLASWMMDASLGGERWVDPVGTSSDGAGGQGDKGTTRQT
jgi:hypothetical protein